MSDFELKQTRTVREEDPRPMLSLSNKTRDAKKNGADAAEQEALWNRSLEFFEQMKSAQAM